MNQMNNVEDGQSKEIALQIVITSMISTGDLFHKRNSATQTQVKSDTAAEEICSKSVTAEDWLDVPVMTYRRKFTGEMSKIQDNIFFRFLSVILCLIPVVDIITDIISFVIYVYHGETWWSTFCWSIIHLNFRFSLLFGIFHPQPNLHRITYMYVPILTIYKAAIILKVDERFADEYESSQNNSPHDGDVSEVHGKLYSPKSIQEVLRRKIMFFHYRFDNSYSCWCKPCMAILYEAALFFISIFVGPYFTIGSSFHLADIIIKGCTEQNRLQRSTIYAKVICFIEALFESLPQMMLQTWIFFRVHIPLWIYLLSISFSIGGVIKASYSIIRNYKHFMQILIPVSRISAMNDKIIHMMVDEREIEEINSSSSFNLT
jgi:hypothetical protein